MNGAKNASSVAKIEPPSSTVLIAGLAMPAVVSVERAANGGDGCVDS